MTKVIVILGPTGVGKTKMSVELAKRYNGEIINADSMQIYKHLNIGTAKITEEEKENIPHYLFDIKELNEDYSVYDYQKDAREKIKDILSRNKTPILVGGTGLYLKACLYNYEFTEEEKINKYDDLSSEQLYNKLKKLDPSTDIHPNNKKRLIRALNYFEINNKPLSSKDKSNTLLYDAIFIGLTTNREKLYDKINSRVDAMFDVGLLTEVKELYDKKIKTKPIQTGIGYKELYDYFDNNITLDDAKELIKKNSRHYAKRQYTFFNNQFDVNWFNINNDFNQTINEVDNYIKKELL